MLHDLDGNVATIVTADGTVVEQAAYSPYGRPDQTGSARTVNGDAPDSQLGFQAAINDPDTGTVILGPRQYDPSTATFTSQDFFPTAGADRTLAVDPLTGNRYLFAASNPVAYHDDGHRPAVGTDIGCSECTTEQRHEAAEAWAEYTRRRIGEGGCRRRTVLPDASDMSKYLRGTYCAPANFPYRPDSTSSMRGDQRRVDPFGACSSTLPGIDIPVPPEDSGLSFDFTVACGSHDYGYDLLRHFELGSGERRAVDAVFRRDLFGHCSQRFAILVRPRCRGWATTYALSVDANTRRANLLGGGVPGGPIEIGGR